MWHAQGHSGSVAEMNEMQEGLFGGGYLFFIFIATWSPVLEVMQLFVLLNYICL